MRPNRRKATEHPAAPGRNDVLAALREAGVPLAPEGLAEHLGLRGRKLGALEQLLAELEQAGEILRNRRGDLCVTEKLGLTKGRVQGHPDGFGFLVPDDGSPDLFLPPTEMREVMHGDRAAARQAGIDRRGRPEGKIVEVLERGTKSVIGRIVVERGVTMLVSEDKRIAQDFLIPPGQGGAARPGQVVVAEIVQHPAKHAAPIARVTEVLGDYGDPGMEIEIALRKHDLPFEFPRAVIEAGAKFSREVTAADSRGREDVTGLALVTIDGETARDFDDAVYAEPQGQGWRLVVAIADVSHYVKPGDPLDREAQDRGNSVYFPRRVIPMLPEVLSNELCSLKPKVDRLCMVCDMAIAGNGAVRRYRFYPAVMHSKARLTYTQVAAALAGATGEAVREAVPLLPHLRNLESLYRVLLQARAKRGAIDFETTETQMIFNERGKIERIVPVERNDAHKIIEECMLAANVCASAFLEEREHPTLYRVHEGPVPEKLENLREFLKGFGLVLGGGDKPKAKDFAKLLDAVRPRPDAKLLQTVMLRSLKQAVYSPENKGHFGLAYDAYTHFTSPIRRYPDLLVHRAIKAVLRMDRYKPGDWRALGEHCSMTERRADEATRDVEGWLKCYYMQDHIGASFTGSVTGVTAFGLFVMLDDIYAEGLIHVSELGTDYFRFDPVHHSMTGERTGRSFRLADRVQVRVARVDLDRVRIDFTLDDGTAGAKRPAARPEKRQERSRGKRR
jgi:ribonuclease R